MRISKSGGGLVVRLPKALVKRVGLRVGDELNIVDAAERTLVVEKKNRREAALESIRARKWQLLADYKFSRDEANER